MPRLTTRYSPLQFSVVRIALGVYLMIYFLRLLPYSTILFSDQGMVTDITLNFTYPFTFWFIHYFTSPTTITFLLCVLILISVLFTFGIYRLCTAFLLWIGWLILFNLNNLTSDPSLAYVGLLLLVYAIVPKGEPLVLGQRFLVSDVSWYMPSIMYWGLWFILGLSFTNSGIEKFSSELWTSGTALYYFSTGPIALSNQFVGWISTWPIIVTATITWLVLYTQILAIVMVCFRKTRIIFWFITTGFFFIAIGVLDLFEVLIGMLLFYTFLIESRWGIKRKKLTIWIDEHCPICLYYAKVIKNEDFYDSITILNFSDTTLTYHLTPQEIAKMNAIVASNGTTLYTGSDAIIRSFIQLGGMWNFCYLLLVIPKKIREGAYHAFAKNRYCIGKCL